MKHRTNIVFAGGGTGGHLFPGLAVAEELAAKVPSMRITFAGSGKPFERHHVSAAGFEYYALPCRPLPRGSDRMRVREAFSFVVENVAGYLAAKRFLAEEQVDAVVGLGGYASVPMGRAAARRRIPLALLEQNIVLGKANRWLARSARLVCTSFDETESQFNVRCPVRMTGNPIRSSTPNARGRLPTCLRDQAGWQPAPHSARPTLLVLGGSGGARALNENVPRALYKIRDSLSGWQILHQSGEADLETTRELYRKFALDATVEAFWSDLPQIMAASSVAVCRAGGTTLAELAAAGVPAVLLPYPHAADDHQRRNAEVFARAGGAIVVDQRELAGRLDDYLAETISGIVIDDRRRDLMSSAMQGLARPHAAAHVASLVWSLVSSQARPRAVAMA